MKALSIINNLPSKKKLNSIFEEAREYILYGNEDILLIKAKIKSMLDIYTMLEKDKEIRQAQLKEAEKYPDKTIEKHGAKYVIKEAGVKYDYSACKCSEWDQLEAKIKMLTEEKKALEDVLKAHKEPWVNEQTGEVIYPPVKTSQTILSVKLL